MAIVIDIAAALIIIVSIYHGYRRGFSGEISGLAGILFALLLSIFVCLVLSYSVTKVEVISYWASFLILFSATFFLAVLMVMVFRKLFNKLLAHKGVLVFDSGGGVIIGLIKGTTFAIIILLMLLLVNPKTTRKDVYKKSVFGRLVCNNIFIAKIVRGKVRVSKGKEKGRKGLKHAPYKEVLNSFEKKDESTKPQGGI